MLRPSKIFIKIVLWHDHVPILKQVEYPVDPTVQEAWLMSLLKKLSKKKTLHKTINSSDIANSLLLFRMKMMKQTFFFFISDGIHNPTCFLFN